MVTDSARNQNDLWPQYGSRHGHNHGHSYGHSTRKDDATRKNDAGVRLELGVIVCERRAERARHQVVVA